MISIQESPSPLKMRGQSVPGRGNSKCSYSELGLEGWIGPTSFQTSCFQTCLETWIYNFVSNLSELIFFVLFCCFLSRALCLEYFSYRVISLAIDVFSYSQLFTFCFVVFMDFGIRARSVQLFSCFWDIISCVNVGKVHSLSFGCLTCKMRTILVPTSQRCWNPVMNVKPSALGLST